MQNKFIEEPLVKNTSYVGWGYEQGIAKIITVSHGRISIERDSIQHYV